MKDYEVRHARSGAFLTTILNVEHELQAKDRFARQKGYKSWGKYSYELGRNSEPPYTFNRIDNNNNGTH